MAVTIEREPNDLLITRLLGIEHVIVHFDCVGDQLLHGRVMPTLAIITLSEAKYGEREPTSDEQWSARAWLASKLGLKIEDVSIA